MEHTFKNGIIMQQYFVFPTNAIINRYKFENKTIFNIDSYTLLIAGGQPIYNNTYRQDYILK